MFAKKDKVTDALDSFWGNTNTNIATAQVDSTPQDIIEEPRVNRINVVQDNIDKATYGYDPYARASTQEAPYKGVDKSALLKDIFEGRRRGKLNVAVESYQTSPLTGKERKITETIDISPDEFKGYSGRLISTSDTDITEPIQSFSQNFTMARTRPSVEQNVRRNPYDIFGMDDFVKRDIDRQKGYLGSGFMDNVASPQRQRNEMENDFLAGMNYRVAPREQRQMSGIGDNIMSNQPISRERQALFRAKMADAAVMRRGLAEEAEYIRSRRLRGEFESGLPIAQGPADYLFGGKRKVTRPTVTKQYKNEKGDMITETTPGGEDIERYGGLIGASKETYKVAKPIVTKTAKATQSFLASLGKNLVKDTRAVKEKFSKKSNNYNETSEKPVDLEKAINEAQEEIRRGL